MRIPMLMAAALLALTGCSGSHDDDVSRAATEWSAALAANDWESACALLAPRTMQELEKSAKKPCVEALPEEARVPSGDAPHVEPFGKGAQASWSEETAFLGDFAGQWLVYAATCDFTSHTLPYDCSISGG